MALQGDLSSFALPDVLRLLAGTAKTGRLVVESARASGEIWLREGRLVGGSVTSAPHAEDAADLVFELLRFDGGSFLFDDGEQLVDGTEPVDVTESLAAAEQLVAEWTEVEAVVPSLRSWVTLSPQLEEDVIVTPDQWKVLASLGAGSTAHEVGDRLELTDLAASRQVKALVEAGLVEIGAAREVEVEVEAAPAADDAPEDVSFDPDAIFTDAPREVLSVNDAYARDLALLSAEDGPVVLESSDDAHLPEPLPGEGTSFLGDLGTIAVDGRSFDAMHADAAPGPSEEAPPAVADTWSSYGAFGDGAADPATPATSGWGDIADEPFADAGEALPDTSPLADAGAAHGGSREDDDRGSLLKFLSTVKP
ncbi:MAG: hypothetical protein JWM47_3193 [Acidimicrobiales bacterium]|nr:hypothetical protein [Acidimicrobiales bacterium]